MEVRRVVGGEGFDGGLGNMVWLYVGSFGKGEGG